MMDATPHNVAAANIDVVQNDTLNNPTSVTVTTPYSFNDFRIRTGSNRGDTNIQIGPSAADDVANGILISNVRDINRDNGPAEALLGIHQGTSAIDGSFAAGYYIPSFNTSRSDTAGGAEYNFDLSAGYFPYSNYLGGWLRNSAGTNGGANNLLTGSPSLVLGTHVIDNGGGQTTIDLRSLGINSQTDGVLIVEGGKNEDNFALSIANADGTWTIFCHDNGADGTSYEQDYVGFVYIPLSDPSLISGKFRGGENNISLQSDPFTVTNPSTGVYHLEIAGQSPATGVLLISAEGGAGNNIDNVVAYEANGNGWDINTRDLPNVGLQNIGTGDAVVSFVFIPGPTPGINISPATGLLTTESGGAATFNVTLDTQPTADVTIALSSSNTAEGTISTSSLTFTTANWNVPQVVTVTGVDDAATDGAVNYSIVTAPAVSADPLYDTRNVVDVTVTNADNEPGITINPPGGLTTTEAGGTATFNVQLNTAPTGDVTFSLTSSNPGEGTISVSSLIFTPANWNTPQTVTITGVNDAVDDGNVSYSIITGAATSTDPLYNNFNAADVGVTNTDNDTAGITVVSTPVTGLTVTENGTTATYTVVLTSQPTANVTIGVTSTDTTEGTVSAPSLLFTAANWNVPQTVTITGVNDVTGDGDISFAVINTATSADPLYAAIDPGDIPVVNRDNDPVLSIAAGLVSYGVGTAGVTIDSLATISDPLTSNYNNYQLVVTLTANADAGDRVEIRNYGTAAGQVGVSGSNVTFGGTTVGTFAGGSGTTPLMITFNASATPAIAQAVLRAVTFRNVNANPPQTTRTASIVINGLGGNHSNTVTRNVQVGLLRVTDLQEGVDRGTGVYNGQVDIQLSENNADTAFPVGSTAGELLIDWPDAAATNTAQVLLKYNNLFGNGPGQIPLGATIVSAELLLNVKNTGDAGQLHRMLVPWNENTDTWNNFGTGTFPRNSQGGVQADDVEAKATSESPWGLIDGSGATGTGVVSVGVTNDLIAWANGQVNEGWLMTGWDLRTDGTAISPSEDADPLLRPRLKVSWLPAGVSTGTFREGLNGYTGVVDTVLRQADPDLATSTELTLGVDAPGPADASQTLLRFDNMIGAALGQIPPGAYIHAATLILSSTTGNSMGNGGQFFPMLQAWDGSATWNSFVGGVNSDGIEAATTATTQAGAAALNPLVQGSLNPFNVTADVQAWVRGDLANNGWAILPWAGGTDGWFFGASDIFVESSRPTLKVFYTPIGVTVTPTSGLFTSETGATATFTVQLDTPPTANVTIPLSSGDTTEGTVGPASLTFTPANWNIPQTVTVTGVDDALPDGSVNYSILTGPATSADPYYNNFDAADVTVSNSDNETAGVTVQPLSGLITNESGGTSAFTIVLNTAPTANVTIGLSSSDTTEGTVAASVTFTPGNWNLPQTVTVTGVNDNQIDGSIAYTIITANTVSTDPNYNNLPVFDVLVTNDDNDVAAINISPTSGLQTTEAGGTATFTVVLATQPTANVSFDLTSSNPAEGTASAGTLSFTNSNWNVPQTVTLTGQPDLLNDPSTAYTIITGVVTSADTNYSGLNPSDVTATNVEPQPFLALPEGTKLFGFGGPAMLVDFQATIVDLDSVNFNTGVLTVQTTAGGTADDRLEVRNVGTGPGQIGVSSSNVSFGGVNIGAIAGGVGTTPLAITLNSAATQAATVALLRAVTFRNVNTTFTNSTRTVAVTLNDGSGSTSLPVSKTIVVGMRRETEFQEGNDAGNGVFSGTSDIQILQTNPDTAYPTGATSAGLSVAGSTGTANSQVLLRFDNIFGTGPGQIPLGSIITSAYLDMDVTDTGQGPVFRRMLTSWDANTSTWNSMTGGIQADDIEARIAVESTLNTATGNGAATGTGLISVGVTSDLQAWSNGEANNGWAMMAFQPSNTNAFIFSPSEAADIADRPKLRVEWIPGGAGSSSFRQGVNGYADAIDTQLTQTTPTTAGNNVADLFVDYTDNATTPNGTHVLLQFQNIIGSLAGQVPTGTKVYSAVLTLPGMGSANTPGDGGSLHTMLLPWDATTTWSTFSDGVQNDGIEATIAESARAGNENRVPNAQAGYNTYDVTGDVQSWLDGTTTNNGWAWLPWVSGSDGWAISSSEVASVNNRPMLTIYYEGVANNAPVNSTPAGPISGTEDTNVPFTGGNLITVSDADVGANLTTTISVPSTAVGTFTGNNGGGGATVTTSNGGATIQIVGSEANVNLALTTLVFIPAPNRDTTSGATTVTVATSDGIATDSDTFNITLASVNDAPSFTAANPPAVNEDTPAVSIPGYITAFNPGPNESSQGVLNYAVTNISNPSLFSVAPAIASNGTLTYTLAANQFGTTTFDVTVTDNGPTGGANVNTSALQTFTLTVNAVNDLPSFTKGPDQNVGFNAGPQTVVGWATGISFGPANEAPQTVSFVVTGNTNAALFSAGPAVASNGTLTFTSATGASGTATITLVAQDSGTAPNQSAPQTFVITVAATPANNPPTIDPITSVTINEDATTQTVNLTGISTGGDSPAQAVVVSVSSSNPALIPTPSLSYTNPSATGSLSFTPVGNVSGSSTITVTVRDNGLDLIPGNSDDGITSTTFTITVNPVNDAPSFTIGANQTVNEDAGPQTVNSFITTSSAGPPDESTQTLAYNITGNTNGALFSAGPSISSTGVLTYTPASNANGTATITVTVSDNGGTANGGVDTSASQSFTITVNAVNDAPTFTVGANQTVNEDAGPQTVNSFITNGSPGPSDEAGQALTYNITGNTNGPLFAVAPSISPTGVLTYTPAPNANGSATITLTLSDNGGGTNTSGPQSFTITVNAVNDVPSFTVGSNQTVNEDAGAQTVNNFITTSSAGPSNESGQTLTYNITGNTNGPLFAVAPSISSTGVLTYTPAPNANGTATITVTVSDNGGTANGGVDTSASQSFTITVNPVNDAPSFVVGPNVTRPFNSPAQTIAGWATGISAGPTDEAGQTLTFAVTGNSNPSLFSVAPAVASNGTLTFTPTAGQQGTATITLQLSDNGGGTNTSGTQSFTITIDPPVNAPPTIDPIANLPLLEDAGLQTVNLSGIGFGGDTPAQSVTVTVASSNTGLIPTPSVSYTSPSNAGTLTFTLASNANGSSLITVTVRDSGLDLIPNNADDGIVSTSFTVNVTPVNDPPDAIDGIFNTLINTPVSGNLIATDIDGPSLTYSLIGSPVLGTVTAFNPATGAFTYTPLPNTTGLEVLSFSVTDGTTSDTAQVRVTIAPLTPVVTASGGNIDVQGTGFNDTIIISPYGSDQALVRTASGSFSSAAIYPLTGTVNVSTGAGNDYIVISGLSGPTILDAGANDDYVSGAMGDDTIIGGSGNDQINASGGNNIVWGDIPNEQDLPAGGDDVLSALTGNDIMYGGGGNDQLYSGDGDDYVHAGQGDDMAAAGLGNDRLFGGAGNDVLSGDAGDDVISGNSGNDNLMGREGNDLLIGGTGGLADVLSGDGGNDLLVGSGTTNDASSTAGDANDTALMALLVNWNSTHGAGLLSAIVGPDDAVNDSLGGATGDDDFYATVNDLLSDFNAPSMGTDRRFP